MAIPTFAGETPISTPRAPNPTPEGRSRSCDSRSRKSAPKREFVLHAGQFALTPDEVSRLLAPIDRLEERALLELALTTGIRREDIVSVPLEGLDLDSRRLKFYEAKKRRTRTVPVDPKVAITLAQYVRTLPKGERWLFPSPRKGGKHETGRFAWTILNRWLERVGLERRPFHSLRATAYKLAKAKGWSVSMAAAILGDTTRIAEAYYGTPTPGELDELMREKPLL
jgi:integrase